MKAIRTQLKRAQAHLYHVRRPLLRARHRAIANGCPSACIAAITKALADNADTHQHIDDIATMLEATNPHFRPLRS